MRPQKVKLTFERSKKVLVVASRGKQCGDVDDADFPVSPSPSPSDASYLPLGPTPPTPSQPASPKPGRTVRPVPVSPSRMSDGDVDIRGFTRQAEAKADAQSIFPRRASTRRGLETTRRSQHVTLRLSNEDQEGDFDETRRRHTSEREVGQERVSGGEGRRRSRRFESEDEGAEGRRSDVATRTASRALHGRARSARRIHPSEGRASDDTQFESEGEEEGFREFTRRTTRALHGRRKSERSSDPTEGRRSDRTHGLDHEEERADIEVYEDFEPEILLDWEDADEAAHERISLDEALQEEGEGAGESRRSSGRRRSSRRSRASETSQGAKGHRPA